MPDKIDKLFWYPSLKYQNIFRGEFDKSEMLDSYVKYFLVRLQSMFKYDGLPDTLPSKWLEHYLITNGNALIIEVDGDKLVCTTGGMGGNPNGYYIPSEYIVSNPYLPIPDRTTYIHDRELVFINQDITTATSDKAVLIYNDTYSQGLIPLITRYAHMLVENDITLYLADIQSRAILNISCSDDNTRASAEEYLSKLRAGKLGVMGNNSFLKDLDMKVFKEAASILTDLIEYHQYLKASLFNELGLNSNYNMKRESINSNESQLNDDMLHPLIDNMLRERKEGIEKVNKMFGTSITVEFDGAWFANEVEEQTILKAMGDSSDIIDDSVEDPVVEFEDDTKKVETLDNLKKEGE